MKAWPAAAWTAWPAGTEPVNATSCAAPLATIRKAASWLMCRCWNTPGGRPAASNASWKRSAHKRRLRRMLEQHDVAGGEGRDDAVDRGQVGIVPGSDDEHQPQRLAADEAREARLAPRAGDRPAPGVLPPACSGRAPPGRGSRPGSGAIGRPICQVISAASSSRRATSASIARPSTRHALLDGRVAPAGSGSLRALQGGGDRRVRPPAGARRAPGRRPGRWCAARS